MQREKLRKANKIEERKKAFASWMLKNGYGEFEVVTQKRLQETFSVLDTSLQRVFAETNTGRIEELASQLILHKQVKEGLGFIAFKDVIDFLLFYDHFLCEAYESAEPKEIRRRTPKEIRESALLFAYCLSRIEADSLIALGFETAGKAFAELALLLGLKPNTIRNMRDEFDPYFDNGRKGWYQRELKGSRKALFEKYKAVSDDDLIHILTLEIGKLRRGNGMEDEAFSQSTSDEQTLKSSCRHKIIIESWATKEIRVKNKLK